MPMNSIVAKPTAARSGSARTSERCSANTATSAAIADALVMSTSPRRRRLPSDAVTSAPPRAPAPDAPMSHDSSTAPTWSTCSVNAGSSWIHGRVSSAAMAVRIMIQRTTTS